MPDLETLTSFPGEGSGPPAPGAVVEFCQVRLVNAEDKQVEDLAGGPAVDDADARYEKDICVGLIFFTEAGEACRYIDDSRSEFIEDVMKRVLYRLGQSGWQAVTVTDDEERDEVWHLQRVWTA